MIRRQQVAAVLVLVLTLVGTMTVSQPTASAAPAGYPSRMTGTTSLRYCTNTGLEGCKPRRSINAGTYVKMNCWVDDSYATGAYRSNRWFYITTQTKVRGFVHSSRVGDQTSVGKCTSHSGVAPARWAAMREGERNRTGLIIPTTHGDWSGDCYTFAWNAHAMTTGKRPISGLGTAHATYLEYKRLGRLNTNLGQASISIGAIVFWKASPSIGSAGHAAIYVGNGHVATTRGNDSDNKPVQVMSMTDLGTPSGWVAPGNL